ncbi:hypothetical protein QBC42DRAFT_289107 [Cladorrhinum samala]|uniref:Uncharacterized protein n=1 Tax=Cladorrhinum samala TaxID=585594 RepID=A0AAV9HLH1_9PEZI|nr:hypothetical protein QBC42DRAFT_289107 [Cladorrhinum samala]
MSCGPWVSSFYWLWKAKRDEQQPGYWENVAELDSARLIPSCLSVENYQIDNGGVPNHYMDMNLLSSLPPPSGPGNPMPLSDFWEFSDQCLIQMEGPISTQGMFQGQAPQSSSSLSGLGNMADPIVIDSYLQSGRQQQALHGNWMPAGFGSTSNPIQLGQTFQSGQPFPGVNAFPTQRHALNPSQIDRECQLGPPIPGNGTIGNPYAIGNAMEQGFNPGTRNEEFLLANPIQTGRGGTAQDPITIGDDDSDNDDGSSGNNLAPEFFIDTLAQAADEAEEIDRARATKRDGQRVMRDRNGYTYINRELRDDPVIKYKPPPLLTRRQQTVNSINDILKKWGRSRTYEQVWGDQSPETSPEPESPDHDVQEEPPSSPPRYGDPDDGGWRPAVPRRRAVQKSRRATPPPPLPGSDNESDDDWEATQPRAPKSGRPAPPQPAQENTQARKRAVASSDAEGLKRKRGRPRKNDEVPSPGPIFVAFPRRAQPATIPQPPRGGQFKPPVQQTKKRNSATRRKAEPKLNARGSEIPARKRKAEAQLNKDGNQVKRRVTGGAPSLKPVPVPVPVPAQEAAAMLPPPLPSSQHASNIDAEDLAEAERRRQRSRSKTADMDAIFVNNFGQQLTRRQVSSLPNIQYMPGGRYGGGKWREKDTDTVWVMLNPIEQVRKPWILEKINNARRKSQTPAPPSAAAVVSASEPQVAVEPTIVVRGKGKEVLPWGLGQDDDDDDDDDNGNGQEGSAITLGSQASNTRMNSRRPSTSADSVNTARRSRSIMSTSEPTRSVSPHSYYGGMGAGSSVALNMTAEQGERSVGSAAGKGKAGGKGKTVTLHASDRHLAQVEEEENNNNNETDDREPSHHGGKGKAPHSDRFQFFGGGKGADFLEEAQRNFTLDPMDTDYSESGDEPMPGEDDD